MGLDGFKIMIYVFALKRVMETYDLNQDFWLLLNFQGHWFVNLLP